MSQNMIQFAFIQWKIHVTRHEILLLFYTTVYILVTNLNVMRSKRNFVKVNFLNCFQCYSFTRMILIEYYDDGKFFSEERKVK